MALDDIFDRIYEQYYRLMYQVAYGILQNTEDTEDVLQESFIRIEKNISKISDPFCPKTRNFVVIITKRLALNMLGKGKGNEAGELWPHRKMSELMRHQRRSVREKWCGRW